MTIHDTTHTAYTTYIFAVGKVNGNRDIVIVPAYSPASEDAYAIGEMDADDGKPCEPLAYFSDLASIEQYIIGYKDAQPRDGELQRLIDYADNDVCFYDHGDEESELQNARDDEEFWRSGSW